MKSLLDANAGVGLEGFARKRNVTAVTALLERDRQFVYFIQRRRAPAAGN